MDNRPIKASAPDEMVFATTPKSPAIQLARIEALICSREGEGVLIS
jgi:hypothetical protein